MTVQSRTATINETLAREMRRAMHFPLQRNIQPMNKKRLAVEYKAGRFVQGTQITIARLPNGECYIVDGNHRLEVVVETGLAQTFTLTIIDVPDMRAVAELYSRFDNHRPRTWGDGCKAQGLAETVPMAPKVMAALGLIQQGFAPAREFVEAKYSKQVRFDLMRDYIAEAALLEAAFKGAPSANVKLIKRAAVLAVALETARYQPSVAVEFWGGVAHDDKLGSTDPRKCLLRWLQNNPVTSLSNVTGSQSKAAALCWNAWYKGNNYSSVQPTKMPVLVLAGTPWNGRPKPVEATKPEPAPAALPEPAPAPDSIEDLFSFGLVGDPAANGMKSAVYAKSA